MEITYGEKCHKYTVIQQLNNLTEKRRRTSKGEGF